MNIQSKNNNFEKSAKEFDLKKIIGVYTKQWKWFVLSCILCMVFAFFHLRYATPEYSAKAKIMLIDNDGIANPAESVLKDLGQLSASDSKMIEDEIEVFRSRKLMKGVVAKLDLNKQFFIKGRLHDTEFFPISRAPIKVNFIATDSILYRSNFSFSVLVTSETTFNFIHNSRSTGEEVSEKMLFGKNVSTPIGDVIVTPNSETPSNIVNKQINVRISELDKTAEKYKNSIGISSAAEGSRIINLSIKNPSGTKAVTIINTLIDEYNRVSIEAKKKKSNNTADFIDNRIDLIATDLSDVDDEIERFKTGNKLTDVTSEADLYLNTSARTEQQLAISRTEFNSVNFMRDQIKDDGSFSRIPSNIGLSDGAINSIANKYNELLDSRDRLLKSSSEKNPTVVNLDQQLNNLKNNLIKSLDNSSKTIRLQIRDLENQSAKISAKIYAVPGQVRESRDIEREREIKESLYLYLLEKREEAAISLISTSSNAKIIDEAHTNYIPVSPKRTMVYLASIMFGLFIPFGFIYVKDLLDNKIHNKEDLENEIKNITVLGEIPKLKGKEVNSLVQRNDRSILSESFRIIRTNFDFVKRGREVDNYNNVVFVTSTINSEGKSFFSMNMALTLANTDKRVLLVGADIRNPQIFSAIKDKKRKESSKVGLTEYLVDKSILVGEAINTYDIYNNKIDILLSGKVPPNPAELLMSGRMKTLFDKVSDQYDYVIVDTAPAMLVTDTLLFSQYAGHTIYLTRAGYTEKSILNFAKELHAQNKLNGMMLVVNDVKQSNFGYGAKYGYYGAQEKKSFFKRKA